MHAIVSVKWHLRDEGLLDVTESDDLDYHLLPGAPVPTGAVSAWAARDSH